MKHIVEYWAANAVLVWFLLGALSCILELLTPGFFLFFFGVGAIITAVVALAFPIGINGQLICFIVSSLGSLLLLRRRVRGSSNQNGDIDDPLVRERYIGREVVVLKAIGRGENGLVELDGTNWQAKTRGAELAVGERVRVVERNGLTLVVAKIQDERS